MARFLKESEGKKKIQTQIGLFPLGIGYYAFVMSTYLRVNLNKTILKHKIFTLLLIKETKNIGIKIKTN